MNADLWTLAPRSQDVECVCFHVLDLAIQKRRSIGQDFWANQEGPIAIQPVHLAPIDPGC